MREKPGDNLNVGESIFFINYFKSIILNNEKYLQQIRLPIKCSEPKIMKYALHSVGLLHENNMTISRKYV